MCLAIPAQICDLLDQRALALVDILGVRRTINIELLRDDPARLGDWVLVHVGFAMSKISTAQADEQLRLLAAMGAAAEAQDEATGYLNDAKR